MFCGFHTIMSDKQAATMTVFLSLWYYPVGDLKPPPSKLKVDTIPIWPLSFDDNRNYCHPYSKTHISPLVFSNLLSYSRVHTIMRNTERDFRGGFYRRARSVKMELARTCYFEFDHTVNMYFYLLFVFTSGWHALRPSRHFLR